jgi:uncharacterized membrane protein YeaQ/YmgE (transglycosylase-associated protein family)
VTFPNARAGRGKNPERERLSALTPSAAPENVTSIGSLASAAVAVVVILLVVILALLLAGSLIGLAFSLLWLALTGLVIGALGRLVLPGRQAISLLATALIGIAASLLGGILANLFDVGWIIQYLVAIALAALGITVFASSEHRRTSV